MKDNKGSEVEDLVQKICASMFIADFSVRSPKFKIQGGQENEVLFTLVQCRGELLVT